jgi:hypothetical protein
MRFRLGTLALVIGLVGLFTGGVFAATGGPDGFGYTFIDSNEVGGPAFAYQDIRITGTMSTISSSDDAVQTGVAIGFTFTFYGTAYTLVNISSNGNLQFNTGAATFTNGPIPTGGFGAPSSAVMPWWDDIDPAQCGDVFYQTLGTAPNRRFIVQWNACHFSSPNGTGCETDFEAILFEGTNEILFQYQDTVFTGACEAGTHGADNGASASVGIQQNSTTGLQYSFNSAVLSPGLAICFRPPSSSPPIICNTIPALQTPTLTPRPTRTPTPTATPTRTPLPTATATNTPRPNVGGVFAPLIGQPGAGASQQAAGQAGQSGQPSQAGQAGQAVQPATGVTPPRTGDGGLR